MQRNFTQTLRVLESDNCFRHLPTNAWRLLIPVTGKAVGLSCMALLPRAPLTFVLALPAVAAATDAIFTGVGRGIRDGKTTPSLTGEFLAGFDLD